MAQVAGADLSLAVTLSGQLYAFGENFYGQLGSATNNGTGNPNPTPALVSLPVASGPVTELAAGDGHSLALTSSGSSTPSAKTSTASWAARPTTAPAHPNPIPALVSLPGASGPAIQITAGYTTAWR